MRHREVRPRLEELGPIPGHVPQPQDGSTADGAAFHVDIPRAGAARREAEGLAPELELLESTFSDDTLRGIVATDALTLVVHPDLAVDCITTDDMARWLPRVEAPVTYQYGRYTVCKAGFWSQGPAMLQPDGGEVVAINPQLVGDPVNLRLLGQRNAGVGGGEGAVAGIAGTGGIDDLGDLFRVDHMNFVAAYDNGALFAARQGGEPEQHAPEREADHGADRVHPRDGDDRALAGDRRRTVVRQHAAQQLAVVLQAGHPLGLAAQDAQRGEGSRAGPSGDPVSPWGESRPVPRSQRGASCIRSERTAKGLTSGALS